MTQVSSLNKPVKARLPQPASPDRAGLYLVKPTSKSHAVPATEPRIAKRSRSLGLLALAAAALAAPLLWFLHEVLTSGH